MRAFLNPAKLALRARLAAFAIHLAISAGLALLLVGVVFFVWYPHLLARASGVTSIFFLVLTVDVLVGPFCTLIVYAPHKRHLKLDLAVIALVQIAAMAYGVHTVFIARPAWMVYNVDRFDLVCANEFSAKSALKAKPEYASPPLTGPQTVAALLPTDVEARNAILFSAATGGYDVAQMPEYYAPFEAAADLVKSRLLPVDRLTSFNKGVTGAQRAKLDEYLKKGDAVGFVPLRARNRDMTVFIDRASGKILEIADLKPWSD